MRKRGKLDEEGAQAIARALSDPSRYTILKQLGDCGAGTPCAQVRESVEITPATLSHHMKELRVAGLIEEKREGRTVRYALCRDVLEQFLDRLRSDLL